MNVFDTIYLDNRDPIEQSFLFAETTFDIEIERANKDYYIESGLIELSNDTVFIEAENAKDTKKENIFITAVKKICTAIRNLITDIAESIMSIFDNRPNITAEEYLESPESKIRLEKDTREIERIVDDEIRKGNKLLQKVSSATGISDETIDNWIRKGVEALEKVAPVIIPSVMAFGFKKLFNSKKKKQMVDEAENLATSGETTDDKKNKQKMKIFGHIQKLFKASTNSQRECAKKLHNARKKKEPERNNNNKSDDDNYDDLFVFDEE